MQPFPCLSVTCSLFEENTLFLSAYKISCRSSECFSIQGMGSSERENIIKYIHQDENTKQYEQIFFTQI